MACAGMILPGTASAQDPDLLPHRATYEMRLDGHGRSGGIEGAHGLLVVEVDDACDAWGVRQAIVLTMMREESQIATASEFDSQEAKDGGWYRFEDQTRIEPGGTEISSGEASMSSDGTGRIAIGAPLPDTGYLPEGTLFPTAHLMSVLRGAMAGEKLMTDILFDGTEGTQVYDVTTLVGPVRGDPESGLRVWPLRLAYFIHGDSAEAPEIELSVDLREDGVALALSYDYGEFVLDADLQSLEMLPEPDC